VLYRPRVPVPKSKKQSGVNEHQHKITSSLPKDKTKYMINDAAMRMAHNCRIVRIIFTIWLHYTCFQLDFNRFGPELHSFPFRCIHAQQQYLSGIGHKHDDTSVLSCNL